MPTPPDWVEKLQRSNFTDLASHVELTIIRTQEQLLATMHDMKRMQRDLDRLLVLLRKQEAPRDGT